MGCSHKFFAASFLIAVLSVPITANAALIDRGNGLIYDDDLDITWLQDANYAYTSGYDSDGKLSWGDAMTWAGTLEYGGYSNWRLPNTPEYTGTGGYVFGSELSHLFEVDGIGALNSGPFVNFLSGVFIDFSNDWYWTNLNYSYSNAFAFRFADGYQDQRSQSDTYSAWAVHDGDIGVVPLPAAVWLFCSGLLGLIGMAKRNP